MTVTPEAIDEIFSKAKCLYTTQQIEDALERMAFEITQRIGDENPIVLPVMIGGLMTTGGLLKHMSFPLKMDYIHATRYKGEVRGREIEWRMKPHQSLKDRVVLLIDDILDGGVTLAEIIRYCKAEGAKAVYTAVLVVKQDSRDPEGTESADFTGLEVPNVFVFGYGMDYKGYLRNAPGIYAVDL